MDLPDEHHVMRLVSFSRLLRDEDERIIGFLPQAFMMREDEKNLSVNWLEKFGGTYAENVRCSVKTFRSTMNVRPKSAFGVGNVKKIKDACGCVGAKKVRILHAPEEDNEAHSVITNLPREEVALYEALADDVFEELIRNADIPYD